MTNFSQRLTFFLFLTANILAFNVFANEDSVEPDTLLSLLKVREHSLVQRDSHALASVGQTLASYYEENYLINDAIEQYQQIYALRSDSSNMVVATNAAMRLSLLLFNEGRYNEALKYVKSAANVYAKLHMQDSLASAYIQLADIYQQQGNYALSERIIIKQALPLSGNEARIRCFKSLGHTYLRQRKYSQAKWFFIQENMLASKMGNRIYVMRSLLYLGQVKTAIRDYGLALNDYKMAERISRSISDSKILAEVHASLADFYKKLGDFSNSRKFASLAQDNKKKLENQISDRRQQALEALTDAQRHLHDTPPSTVKQQTVKASPNQNFLLLMVTVLFVLSGLIIIGFYLKRRRSLIKKG